MAEAAPAIQKNDFVFDFSQTQEQFVFSEAEVVMFMGPMGEGKTYGGVGGLIAHAQRCGCDIRGAMIRDTHQNIKISTAPDIQQILGNFVTFHDDYKKMVIHSTPRVDVDLFGIDDPASLSKLQGPQYAIIWLEEPAPIAEKANAGLPRGVFEMAIARAARQTGTIMRVQVTQNPADEDHWTEEVAQGPRILSRDPMTGTEITLEVFRIPYGENKKLNPHARAANIAAFKSDAGKYARYVEGRAASVCQGQPVVKTYHPATHYCQEVELPVIPGAIGVRGWDLFHSPACIIGQYVPPGRLIVHDVVTDTNVGVRELIEMRVKPLLNSPKYKGLIQEWRDIGDPSGRTPDQSSTRQSAARVIEDLLHTRFEPGPTRWDSRINPAITAFTRLSTDGRPLIELSRTAYPLHRSLNGGWHWKVDNNNRIIGNLPVKNEHSHPGDAFLYLVAELFPYELVNDTDRRAKKLSQKARMARAMSYASAYGHKQAAGM